MPKRMGPEALQALLGLVHNELSSYVKHADLQEIAGDNIADWFKDAGLTWTEESGCGNGTTNPVGAVLAYAGTTPPMVTSCAMVPNITSLITRTWQATSRDSMERRTTLVGMAS